MDNDDKQITPESTVNFDLIENTDHGQIKPARIVEEMERSYLDYAMSVIVARALPDVRDGLKPVHRRILFAMKEMGLTHKSAYKKSARVVGEVLGKFHPHGDQAVYQTMVRLAQDFSMRYPLVDGQGNFGSIDGDSAAAMRYTEARLSKIADPLLEDIDKDTVEFGDNFDGSQREPLVLPAKLPNLLLMGGDGIAVGMATKIPPHNLKEVAAAIAASIDKSTVSQTKIDEANIDTQDSSQIVGTLECNIEVDELLEHIKGPDFPTAGQIYDIKEIRKLYETGKANIVNRGVAEIVEKKNGRFQIIITELPYQVNKAKLITHIADLVKKKKIDGISDLRDESDRKGMTVAIELKRDAKPKSVLNNLYKFTELQSSFPANMVALTSEGTPHLMTLKLILTEHIHHRQHVVVKRSQFELREAKARAHILEGLLKALGVIDEVIETIKKSEDTETAKTNLMKRFGLSEIQSIAILDMQLKKLAHLEREKLEAEYKELMDRIKHLISVLKDPKAVLQIIKDELKQLSDTFGDQRRTKIYKNAVGEFSEEDLIPSEETIITLTKTGYIKRMPLDTFRSQRRGGKGVTGMTVKDTDEIQLLTSANTHDHLLVFTNKGRVFDLKVWELPEGSRVSKGQAIINLINITPEETIQSLLPLSKETIAKKVFLFFTTKDGVVKRTKISDYANIRNNGLIAIKLGGSDRLVWVNQTSGSDYILLVTKEGKSIRFDESDVRPTSRDTMGVRGILLAKDDYVVSMENLNPEDLTAEKKRGVFKDLLVISEGGMGKRTDLRQYPLQNRGGQGVKVAELSAKTGKIAGALIVTEDDSELLITTREAQAIKLPIKNIPQLQRSTQGVILMRFAKAGDTVAAVTTIAKEVE